MSVRMILCFWFLDHRSYSISVAADYKQTAEVMRKTSTHFARRNQMCSLGQQNFVSL